MGYCVLAKGHSIAYLLLEVCYDIFFGLLVWWCYKSFGLIGAGIAFSVGALYDVVIYFLYCHFRYGFVFRRSTLLFCLGQFACLLAAVEYCYIVSPSAQQTYIIGGIIFVLSSFLSLRRLLKRSDRAKGILNKLRK